MLALVLGLAFSASAQTPAGTPIDNTAAASFAIGGVPGFTSTSNTLTVITAASGTSPRSRVLDAQAGALLTGVSITLVDDATGLPAPVLGDDGVSIFPSTVVSGGTTTDSGGTSYVFPPGTYRFPIVPAGTYRLDVVPPASHVYPSAEPTGAIQSLPGAPYAIVAGSRAGPFTVAATGPIAIDIPLDPFSNALFLSKTTSSDVAGLGDFLSYDVRVRNPGAAAAPLGMLVTDVIPQGFLYRPGSTRIDGVPAPDPTISGNGRTLGFALGPVAALQNQHIAYVLEVTTGTPLGPATNHATSQVVGGTTSFDAQATVVVQDDLFSSQSFVMGQVVVNSCDLQVTNDLQGLPGARVYLEDGTFAVTDERGLFDFEGLEPGNHVVQLDVASLPPEYEAVSCEPNTRFAGRTFSQFVDLQRGSLWRADFHVRQRPRASGYVNLELKSVSHAGIATYRVELNGAGVPIRRLRAVVQLPDEMSYEPGSSTLNSQPLADPEGSGGLLTYRLGGRSGAWSQAIEFKARIAPAGSGEKLESRAYALFETPTAKTARTPLATNLTRPKHQSWSGVQIVETTGLVRGEEWPEPEAPATSDGERPEYDAAWLERAAPGLEWLLPGPGFAPKIPSVNVSIKHDPAQAPTLHLNGEPVSPLNYEGWMRNSSRSAAISRWRGIDLTPGTNTFEAITRDEAGTETGRIRYSLHYPGPPVAVELVPEESRAVADGRTTPVIAVRLLDRFGKPVREGVVGAFSVAPPHTPEQEREALQRRQLAGLAPEQPQFSVGPGGIAHIRLAPTTETGRVLLRFALDNGRENEVRSWLEPEAREWIVVGLGEGLAGYNRLSGNRAAAEAAGLEKGLQVDDRAALFAQGRVSGDWLLTLAYDSRGQSEPEGETLNRLIDPDRFYTLYGSTAAQDYAAPTSERLYVKVERERFYAMFGDYTSSLDDTELSRYSRSFTGFKSEYDGDRFGYAAFATETDYGFVRDEIRGDGTSGLYRLSRRDLVRNSEEIVLETRDRFHSERILESRPLARHLDYNVDYAAGTLFFKEPIPSKSLGLDPIFIVVRYEAEDLKDESMIAGGRGSMTLAGERAELGASVIHEGTTGQDGDLVGADLRVRLHPTTEFHAEVARTDTHDPLGAALKGSAYLAQLETRSARLDARAYYRSEDAAFGLGQQNQSELGTRKLGADARFRLTDRMDLNGELYRQTNLESELDRDALEARVDFREAELYLFGGLRFARDDPRNGSDAVSQQLLGGGSYSLLQDRLRLRLNSELALGSDENVDFPSRVILGSDFDVTDGLTAFAEHEFAFGEDVIANGSRVGLRATPWTGSSVHSSLEQRMTENGGRTFANLGLSQSWQATDRWTLDASLDRTQTLRRPAGAPLHPAQPLSSGSLDGDFTALSFGSSQRSDHWSWTSRVETRFGESEDKWNLFSGFYRELTDGVGTSVSLELLDTDADGGAHESLGNLEVGFVYRPLGSRWILLDRLDLRFERERGSTFDVRNRKLVNNLHANYRWNRRSQISLQYGAKYLLDRIGGDDYDGYTDLVGFEARYDLGDRWDVGFAARMLHSWDTHRFERSYGVSIGRSLVTNVWLSAGYNFAGFRDDDFTAAEYTAKGPFLRFRYKFDQDTIRELLTMEWSRF